MIDEGPRCEINNVRFIGVNKFREEDIKGMLQLTAGQPFDGTMLLRDKATIEQIYGSYGYVFADVKPEPQVTEDASRMDLVYVIEEGKRYRVGDILVQIDGEKPHTNIRTVLNRIELQPGDIVDVRKLRRSEVRLQRSQLFAVDPQRGIRPQLVVQPAGDPDGGLMAGKLKDSATGNTPNRSANSANKAGSSSASGYRGQSPDDWHPDDQVIGLRLVGQANPNPAPQRNEAVLPPQGALPDGRFPPALKTVSPPRGALPQNMLPRSVPPQSVPPTLPSAGHVPSSGLNAIGPFTPPAAAPRFRSWGAVPTTRP